MLAFPTPSPALFTFRTAGDALSGAVRLETALGAPVSRRQAAHGPGSTNR
jgi:hypothetical protein